MPDYHTALSLDGAVMRFGVHVENKLQERLDSPPYTPIYTLAELLDTADPIEDALRKNSIMFDAFHGAIGGSSTVSGGMLVPVMH